MENTINQLLKQIQLISESYERVAEATGENFNIFSVLQMETDEVKTHSRFIAELLNPNGSHGQKDIFLKKFIELLEIEDFDTQNANIFVEFYIGEVTNTEGGRIDILIKNKDNKVVMIENKVYANEQLNQLQRYYNYRPNEPLLYLTLDGKTSTDENINFPYQCISYREHIISWLEVCRKEVVTNSILRETVTQYINLIKKLTGQNINTKMSQEIATRILKDKESFEAYNNLYKAKDEVRKLIFSQELFPLIDKTANKFKLHKFVNEEQLLNNKERWSNNFWFKNSETENLNLLICFAFNREKTYQGFIYGFSYLDIDGKKDYSKYPKIKDEFRKRFTNTYQGTKHWLCWRYFDEYRDFEDLETLKNIKFGKFKEDLQNKVKEMLDIINSL